MEVVGWIGAILFSLCGIPQAMDCLKKGHARGLAPSFLGMWLAGEALTLIYVIPKGDWPLITNYAVNLICLLVILRFKIWEATR